MIFAESPVLLCSAHTTVYVVLRGNPSTAAWALSESMPEARSASPISAILRVYRIFISMTGLIAISSVL
jgi:hypothetical protein